MVDGPYPWCDTLSEDCNCHGIKGNLAAVYCSDFGSHDESDKRASKSPNVRHTQNVKIMRQTLIKRQGTQRANRDSRPNVQHPTPAPEGIYCQIDRRFHAYSEQVKQEVEAQLVAISLQARTWDEDARQTILAQVSALKNHYLRQYQTEECAETYVAGTSSIPMSYTSKYLEVVSTREPAHSTGDTSIGTERRHGMQHHRHERYRYGHT